MSENTAIKEREEAQKVAERKEPEVDDTEPEDEPENANEEAGKEHPVRGRRGGRHEHKHQMRWTDARVLELMRCAAEMERPPNVAGWGKVITSFQSLLEIVQRAPNAVAVWGPDLHLLTTAKLHSKFDQVLRQVYSGRYRPDADSPASFIDDLHTVVKQLTDKQKMLEAGDGTDQGRWDAALRRVSEAWAAAPERTDVTLSKRRIATAKQLLLGVRRMTPVFDEHGVPLFPPLVRWNFDTNMPEVVSLSDAPNTPHTARAFRDSLGQGPRGRRGGGARRSVARRRNSTATAAEGDGTTAEGGSEESNKGEQVDSSTDEEDEGGEEEAVVATPARNRRARRRSSAVEVPERMKLRKRDRRTYDKEDEDDDEDNEDEEEENEEENKKRSNKRIRMLQPEQRQQVPLAHCLGTGEMNDLCLCRLTRTELLSYGVAITGVCPDCKHKLSYHS